MNAPAVRLTDSSTVYDRIRLAWNYNDHGDGRTHLAVGYRFARWRGAGGALVSG